MVVSGERWRHAEVVCPCHGREETSAGGSESPILSEERQGDNAGCYEGVWWVNRDRGRDREKLFLWTVTGKLVGNILWRKARRRERYRKGVVKGGKRRRAEFLCPSPTKVLSLKAYSCMLQEAFMGDFTSLVILLLSSYTLNDQRVLFHSVS